MRTPKGKKQNIKIGDQIMKSLIAALVLSIGFGTVAHAAGYHTQSNGALPTWAADAFEPKGS